MIKNYLLFFFFIFGVLAARSQHPFKYDNTVYKAVYPDEAFRLMDSIKQYILLDVRSPGEYADSSRTTALNIGHIKGSVNISIDSIPGHLTALNKYADQPVFIYCSHSQRSRRVSKLLAENGFKKVYNINGGMTLINDLDDKSFPNKNKLLLTHLIYKNLPSTDAYRLIKNTPDLVIIDIRTEKEFMSKDSLQQNNIGHLKNAINIPQADFAVKFDSFNIPVNSPVLLYDQYGYNSMDVTDMLNEKGFNRIYNLFEGLEGFACDNRLDKNSIGQVLVNAPTYHMLDPEACLSLIKQQQDLVIIDSRSTEEYTNKSDMFHLNLGHIKGAVNISSLKALEPFMQKNAKSTPLLIYGSGSDAGAAICQELVNKGYQNVNFLSEGLYHFVWSAANVENCRGGMAFLTDHEGLY